MSLDLCLATDKPSGRETACLRNVRIAVRKLTNENHQVPAGLITENSGLMARRVGRSHGARLLQVLV